METLMKEIEKWSKVYDFNFQFWHKNNSVYIEKRGVELYSTGGYNTAKEALKAALEWVYSVNKNSRP